MKRHLSYAEDNFDNLLRDMSLNRTPMNYFYNIPARRFAPKRVRVDPMQLELARKQFQLDILARRVGELEATQSAMEKFYYNRRRENNNARFSQFQNTVVKMLTKMAPSAPPPPLPPLAPPLAPPLPPLAPPLPPRAPPPPPRPVTKAVPLPVVPVPLPNLPTAMPLPAQTGGFGNLANKAAKRAKNMRRKALLDSVMQKNNPNVVEAYIKNYGYDNQAALLANLGLTVKNIRP